MVVSIWSINSVGRNILQVKEVPAYKELAGIYDSGRHVKAGILRGEFVK
jgi:hypothetical protein